MVQRKIVKKREVFWDAVGMIAVTDNDDSLHDQAIAVRDRLFQEGTTFVTTDDILVEVGNGLSKLKQRPLAVAAIQAIRDSVEFGVIEIVYITSKLFEKGWLLYQGRMDKEWGLTDCISFVVMKERNITEAFTSDHHFEQAGFTNLLQIKKLRT